MANTRTHRRYDHRLRSLVRDTGNIRLAIENGIPRSTARDWSQSPTADAVSLDVLSMSENALQQEVLALRQQNARLTAILRLVVVLFMGWMLVSLIVAMTYDKSRSEAPSAII